MKHISTHEGKLEVVGPFDIHNKKGPRYRLRVDGWPCITKLGYKKAALLPLMDGKKVRAEIGLHYDKPTLADIKLIG